MTRLTNHLRPALIAFLAIVGSFFAPGVALASSGRGGGGADSCCLKWACTVCCCESSATQPEARSHDEPMALRASTLLTDSASTRVSDLSRPMRSCECRPGTPAAPAAKDESRASVERSRLVLGEPSGSTCARPSLADRGRPIRRSSHPPNMTSELRTTHLQI